MSSLSGAWSTICFIFWKKFAKNACAGGQWTKIQHSPTLRIVLHQIPWLVNCWSPLPLLFPWWSTQLTHLSNRYEKDNQSQIVHFSFEIAHLLSYEWQVWREEVQRYTFKTKQKNIWAKNGVFDKLLWSNLSFISRNTFVIIKIPDRREWVKNITYWNKIRKEVFYDIYYDKYKITRDSVI